MSLQDRVDTTSTASMRAAGHLRLVTSTTIGAGMSTRVTSTPAAEERASSAAVSSRALAMLRAVAAGRAELVLGCELDMLIDGLPCCDQFMAHDLARAVLVRPARLGLVGHRVPAVLTHTGQAVLSAAPSVA